MSINYGWQSRYDYEGMSNTEKYYGRELHSQDRNWAATKIVYVLFIIACAYLLITELHWSSFVSFFTTYLF